jgi:hypothetical protein
MWSALAFIVGLVLMYNSAEEHVSVHKLPAHDAVCMVKAL